jgi:hypothetical protein
LDKILVEENCAIQSLPSSNTSGCTLELNAAINFVLPSFQLNSVNSTLQKFSFSNLEINSTNTFF